MHKMHETYVVVLHLQLRLYVTGGISHSHAFLMPLEGALHHLHSHVCAIGHTRCLLLSMINLVANELCMRLQAVARCSGLYRRTLASDPYVSHANTLRQALMSDTRQCWVVPAYGMHASIYRERYQYTYSTIYL